MNFLSADVPDPTDFPPQATAPGLRTLDGSFRCDICGELYDAPVTIACGHCFCSACIRTSFSNKQECPTCRKPTNEAHIRPNPVLESVISAWKEARPVILRLVKREEDRRAIKAQQADKGAARKRKRMAENSSSSSSVTGNTPGPSRGPLSPNRALGPKSPSRVKKLKISFNDDVELNVVPSSDIEEELVTQSSKLAPKEEALIECPICQKKMPYRELNTHIDNKCRDVSSHDTAAKSWSMLMGGGKNRHQKGKHKAHRKESDSDDEHPLPLTTYTTLKDKQLKDMLIQQELPTTGNRSNWEQRHRQWITLYNANLDKSITNRKSKAELRKDLKRLEAENPKKKKTVITDVKTYQKEQKSEFARLVEAARPKKSEPPNSKDTPKSTPPINSTPPPPASFSTEPGDTIVIDSEEE